MKIRQENEGNIACRKKVRKVKKKKTSLHNYIVLYLLLSHIMIYCPVCMIIGTVYTYRHVRLRKHK